MKRGRPSLLGLVVGLRDTVKCERGGGRGTGHGDGDGRWGWDVGALVSMLWIGASIFAFFSFLFSLFGRAFDGLASCISVVEQVLCWRTYLQQNEASA